MERAALIPPSSQPIRALDLFAGAGGSSCGARMAGVSIVAAVDAWPLARETYVDNFDGVTFYRRKCENISPEEINDEVGPIQLILASPECTSHTCAKGSAERSELSRKTAFQVVRFARVLRPRWLLVENVIQMRNWDRYAEWTRKLENIGYHVSEQVLNSAEFGVPQSRKRMFILCDLESTPASIELPDTGIKGSAAQIVDMNGTYSYSPLRAKGRAKATLQRARRAIAHVGTGQPFLIVYYGSDGAGGWQSLTSPLRTITTVDRFAYVRPSENSGHEMRMLQVPELKKAMGFPDDYRLRHGTRRDKIKLLGNAVCPPVIKAIIERMTKA